MNTSKNDKYIPAGIEKLTQTINKTQNMSKSANTDLNTSEKYAGIRVVGVGGAGCNAVNRMIHTGLKGVDFISINTDPQALFLCDETARRIPIGQNTTKGVGAGGNPEIGQKAIEENRAEVVSALQGADMVFITAGMGGGTGTGASPIVAEIAKEIGALSVAVVTKPFSFEGKMRGMIAEQGIAKLKEKVDALIVIPNDNLLKVVDKKTSLIDAFKVADDVLRYGVQGITDIMTIPGLINVDFADIQTIMLNSGSALMGIGMANGDQRAAAAAEEAIKSTLQDTSIDGAKGVLFCITGSSSMTLAEVDEASRIISQAVDPDAKIIFGTVIDEAYADNIMVTVIATGFSSAEDSLSIMADDEQQDYSQQYNTYQQSDYGKSEDYDQISSIPSFSSAQSIRERFLKRK